MNKKGVWEVSFIVFLRTFDMLRGIILRFMSRLDLLNGLGCFICVLSRFAFWKVKTVLF